MTTVDSGATLTSLQLWKNQGKAVVSHSGWVCVSYLCGGMGVGCEDTKWGKPGTIKPLTYLPQ